MVQVSRELFMAFVAAKPRTLQIYLHKVGPCFTRGLPRRTRCRLLGCTCPATLCTGAGYYVIGQLSHMLHIMRQRGRPAACL